eukprot:7382134-Prymnesium_polylepis.1
MWACGVDASLSMPAAACRLPAATLLAECVSLSTCRASARGWRSPQRARSNKALESLASSAVEEQLYKSVRPPRVKCGLLSPRGRRLQN